MLLDREKEDINYLGFVTLSRGFTDYRDHYSNSTIFEPFEYNHVVLFNKRIVDLDVSKKVRSKLQITGYVELCGAAIA